MERTEAVVVGAGPVGMALAVALAQARIPFRILDARGPGAAEQDRRVLALAHGSRQILARLGVWGRFQTTPIETIHISHRGGFGRTLIRAADYGLPALGYVADAAAIATALHEALTTLGIEVDHDTRVANVAATPEDVVVSTDSQRGATTLRAKLVAHAEGAVDSKDCSGRDYGQQAIITAVRTAEPPKGTAYERFTADGPLALLPYRDGYAVVYTAATAEARRLVSLDDAAFLGALQAQFGTRRQFVSATPRAAFPLALKVRPEPVAPRCVWLGNAAQTLHPVAGQGFNLALRDVWSLSEVLTRDLAGDPGAVPLLARYRAARQLDRRTTITFTDTLIRVFGSTNPLLTLARGSGLAALDLLPPLREFVARRMIFGARGW
jgi:2-octaprenyl-6-methoxyphenol hydroxylase